MNFLLTTEGGVKKYFADISADFRPFIAGSRSPLLTEAPLSLFYLLCRNQSPPRLTCQQPLTTLMIQCWSGCVVCAANGSQRSVLSSLLKRRFFRIFHESKKRTWRARHARRPCLAGVSRSPSVLQAKFYHGYFLFQPCNVFGIFS